VRSNNDTTIQQAGLYSVSAVGRLAADGGGRSGRGDNDVNDNDDIDGVVLEAMRRMMQQLVLLTVACIYTHGGPKSGATDSLPYFFKS